MRRILSLALLLAVTASVSAADPPELARPNIVFFLADDQSTATIGCYGNDVIQTPHIDAIAARGTRFDSALAACPRADSGRRGSVIINGTRSDSSK